LWRRPKNELPCTRARTSLYSLANVRTGLPASFVLPQAVTLVPSKKPRATKKSRGITTCFDLHRAVPVFLMFAQAVFLWVQIITANSKSSIRRSP